jgi:hypothetical protein
MTVLILSSVEDVHAQAVMDALAAKGARAELVDLSEFPTRLALSMAFEDNRRRLELSRRGGRTLHQTASIRIIGQAFSLSGQFIAEPFWL